MKTELHTIYLRMTVSMAVFFVLGIYARSILIRILEEVEEKRRLEEERQREEQEALEIEAAKAAAASKSSEKGRSLDIKVNDYGEDFSPLTVSQIISSDKN